MLYSTLDVSLKVGTITLLLVLTGLLLRDIRGAVAGRLAVALALGTVAHVLSAAGFAAPMTPWRAPLIALSTGNIVVLWLFARAVFDDMFRLRWWHAAAWAAVAGLSLINCLGSLSANSVALQAGWAAIHVAELGFIALALGQTVATWSADLVEGRRKLRVGIIGAASAYGAINSVLHLALSGSKAPEFVTLANAILLAVIVVAILFALTRVDATDLIPAADALEPAAAPLRRALPPDLTPTADRKLIDALNRLMADDRIYRHEGVTIGMLATRLAVPEYRLRRLINQRLGYRNFNVFLNNHRIAEAKAALADPTQVEVPVITIAMDAGFQSLGPFNRAFKATTGVTPTEYRRSNAVPA